MIFLSKSAVHPLWRGRITVLDFDICFWLSRLAKPIFKWFSWLHKGWHSLFGNGFCCLALLDFGHLSSLQIKIFSINLQIFTVVVIRVFFLNNEVISALKGRNWNRDRALRFIQLDLFAFWSRPIAQVWREWAARTPAYISDVQLAHHGASQCRNQIVADQYSILDRQTILASSSFLLFGTHYSASIIFVGHRLSRSRLV